MSKHRLLLLLNHSENKRLLIDWLTPKFEIILPSEADPSLTALTVDSFDLAIFDLVELGTWRRQLSIWRTNAEPLFLPTLALMPPKRVGSLPIDLLYQIDEVITIPVDPAELDVRIATLLRARLLSQNLATQNQRLEEMNTLKTRFVSIVSHEFRNPLSLISGMVQLLERQDHKLAAEKKKSMFQRIHKGIGKLTNLLDDLLVLNRNASSQVAFKPQFFDLGDHCQKISSNLALGTQGARNIDFQPSTSQQDALSNVYMDAALIETILSNLLSNALKYSPPDSPVSLSLTHADGQVVFEVKDQGRGIPMEDQATLFEAFFRARNVGATPGTGLGLNIVKQCIDLHQGTIDVYSQVNQGTTFVVRLPSGL